MKNWTKNRTASVEDADEEDNDDDEEWVADWNRLDVIPDEEAVDEEINFEPGDTLGKALALVTQVSLVLRDYVLFLIILRYAHLLKPRLSLPNVALRREFLNLRLSSGSGHGGVRCMISPHGLLNAEMYSHFLKSCVSTHGNFFRLSRHFVQRLIDISLS